jgi:hypothetical protein
MRSPKWLRDEIILCLDLYLNHNGNKIQKNDPKIAELWDDFIGLSKTLEPNGKAELNTFWSTYANGQPKPTKQTATEKELEALIGECIRISFQGTEVTGE